MWGIQGTASLFEDYLLSYIFKLNMFQNIYKINFFDHNSKFSLTD